MSDTKLLSTEPSMLDKAKAVLIENKKILITIVVVGIVLGLVYYFSTQGPTKVDDDNGGTTGCPICENADCSVEEGRIGVLEQEKLLLQQYKTGAERRILTLEMELDNTEDALERRTRDFIGSTTGLTIATVLTGIGGFFLAKRLYSSESAPASTSKSTATSDTG